MIPPPVVERHGQLLVVRDDLLPGGTKRRFLTPLLDRWPELHFVYGGPAQGYAQVALGWAAHDTGKRATVFVAERKTPSPLTAAAAAAGARIVPIRPGYLAVVQARARAYAHGLGARFLPLGFDLPEVLEEAAARLAELKLEEPPPEVWVTAGSGLLSRALQLAFPCSAHHAVRVGLEPHAGAARLWRAPERFEARAEHPPPFPSASAYDAKAWRFVAANARAGALFWNVGA